MSLINRLFQRMTWHSRSHRARRRREFSPFGIQAAQVQVLETRRLLSALTVTTAADSGAGSLRAEIAAANSGDTINFAASLKGQTITLTSGELLINKGLTIQGPGAAQLTISGGNASRVFDVTSSQPVVLTGLTISNGRSTIGGAISDAAGTTLTVSNCTVSNSHLSPLGKYGGGIYNAGTLTVNGSNLTRDSAFAGGGIFNAGTLTSNGCTLSGDVAHGGSGGGIYNEGTLTAKGCTLSGDSAGSLGGGIYAAGGTATLKNCTLSGDSGLQGGGLYVTVGASATLENCTVSLNSTLPIPNGSGVNDVGGGIYIGQSALYPPQYGIVNLTNTIVAGNTVGGIANLAEGADIYGSVALADHDLIGNGWGSNVVNGVNGNLVGGNGRPVINAMLGPLRDNGGPTMTMALLAGSPAVGQVDSAFAPVTDQRGVTRRDLPGELTDIGAYEV
jgi:hypothetical protein